MRKDGVNPDMLILGSAAQEMLLQNEKFLKLLDNRRVEIGEIKPAELENGIGYLGRMIVPGSAFDLYTYEEWIPDEVEKDAFSQAVRKIQCFTARLPTWTGEAISLHVCKSTYPAAGGRRTLRKNLCQSAHAPYRCRMTSKAGTC